MFSHSCSSLSRRTISRPFRCRPRLRPYHRSRWIRDHWSFAFVRRRTKYIRQMRLINSVRHTYLTDLLEQFHSFTGLFRLSDDENHQSLFVLKNDEQQLIESFSARTRCFAKLSFRRYSNSRISATCSTLVRSLRCIPCWMSDDCTEYS